MNVTVSRKATGKYFVSLCVEEEVEIFSNNGGEIGIDVGIKEFYSDSNGDLGGSSSKWGSILRGKRWERG